LVQVVFTETRFYKVPLLTLVSVTSRGSQMLGVWLVRVGAAAAVQAGGARRETDREKEFCRFCLCCSCVNE